MKYICFLVFVFSPLAWSADDGGIDVVAEPPLLKSEFLKIQNLFLTHLKKQPPKYLYMFKHWCHSRGSFTSRLIDSHHPSREEACVDQNMESGHATVLFYTCVAEDNAGDVKTLYSSLPAVEACGEGYKVDTSGLERIANIFCEGNEDSENCKSEQMEVLLDMFLMSDKGDEYPLIDTESEYPFLLSK